VEIDEATPGEATDATAAAEAEEGVAAAVAAANPVRPDATTAREAVEGVSAVIGLAAAAADEARDVAEAAAAPDPRRKSKSPRQPKNWMPPWMIIGRSLGIKKLHRRNWMMIWMIIGPRREGRRQRGAMKQMLLLLRLREGMRSLLQLRLRLRLVGMWKPRVFY